MAFLNKKSRPINVENEDFRYVLSTGKPDEEWNFNLNLTVQDASGQGQVLKVVGLVTRDFWLDFPYVKDKEAYPVLTRKHIAQIIKTGIKTGWIPKERGRPFVLKLDDQLFCEK